MEKVFWLKFLSRLFYLGTAIFAFAFIANLVGSKARFDLPLAAMFLVFLGLLGEIAGNVAGKILQRDSKKIDGD